MTYGIFFNNIKNLSKKRDTDPTLHLSEILKLIYNSEINKNNVPLIVTSLTDPILHLSQVFELICKNKINENNIGLIVNSLKFYIFERKPTDSHMKWEIKVAMNCLDAPQLESHLKNYLGVDITDDEMTDSLFGKPRHAMTHKFSM